MARLFRSRALFPNFLALTISATLISFGLVSASHASAVPTVTSISPTSGTAAGGTTVTVSGTDFDPASTTVTIDGVSVIPTSVSSTSLSFVTPVRDLEDRGVGAKAVVVTTDLGSSTESVTFTYRPILVTNVGQTRTVVRLNELASRSMANPITRAQEAPFTVTGKDELSGEEYSYVTDIRYNTATAAYNKESHEAVGTMWPNKSSSMNVNVTTVTRDGRSGVFNLNSNGSCTSNNRVDGGNIANTYCAVFGPEIYSEPFFGVAGQALSFEWSAAAGSDDYEVYAFLVKVPDDTTIPEPSRSNHTLLVHSLGRNQPFVSSSGNITESGQYRFRFVNGSYDATGGFALGSNMYIDPNIIVGTANVINFSPVSDQIGASGNFNINITSSAGGAVSVSSSTTSICTVASSFVDPNTVVTVTKLGTGTCILNANQGATGGFAPASRVQRAFEIRASATVPIAPSITSVVGENGQLRVNFNPPGRDGGAVVTNYKYRIGSGDWVELAPSSTTSPIFITGLTNGTSYSITIRAVNSEGEGAISTAVSGIPQASAPGAPVILTIAASDEALSVAFTAPANDGGSSISNYEYSLDGGSWATPTPAVISSPLEISGLTNGLAYSVRIRGVNNTGGGTPSNSVVATPTDVVVTAPVPPTVAGPIATPTPTPTVTPRPNQSRRPAATAPAIPRPTATPTVTPSPTITSTPAPRPTPGTIPFEILEREATPGVVFSPTNPIPQDLVDILFSPLAYADEQTTSAALPTLSPTESVAFENGAPIQANLTVTSNGSGYVLQGDTWQVALEATDTQGAPLVLDDSGNIVLNSDRFVQFQGTGFAPGSIIKVWLFSDPSSIADVVADSDGNFTGNAQLPADIPDGEHTIQLNGLSKDGQVRSVALGVIVQPDIVAVPTLTPVDVTPLWNFVFITAGIVMMFLLVLLARKRSSLIVARRAKRKEQKLAQRSNRALAKQQKRDSAKQKLLMDEMDPFLAQQVSEASRSQQFPNDSRRKIGPAAPPNRKRNFKPKNS